MSLEQPEKKEYTPEEIKEMDKMRERVDKLRETDDPYEEADSVEELAYFEKAKRAEIEDNLKKILQKEKNYIQEELDKEVKKKSAHIDFIGNLVSTSELGKMEENKKSWIDEKTGLRSHRYLEDNISGILDRERRDYKREGKKYKGFSVMVIDIDNFKLINDTFGHNEGDEVLAGIAKIVRENVRISDFPCRWGGDEIIILLPNCNTNELNLVIERIRNELEKAEFNNKKSGKITLSIGYVNSRRIVNMKWKDIFQRADCAMYYGKKTPEKNMTVNYYRVPKDFIAQYEAEKKEIF